MSQFKSESEFSINVANLGTPFTGTLDPSGDYVPGVYNSRFGELTVSAKGQFSFLSSGEHRFAGLRSGESLSERFNIWDRDGNALYVKVTYSGATGAEAHVQEDYRLVSGVLKTGGALTPGQYVAAKQSGDSIKGSFSVNSSGVWSWSLAGSSAALQSLRHGETVLERFVVNKVHGGTETVDVLITGTNDIAVIKAVAPGKVVEDKFVTLADRDFGYEAGTQVLAASGTLSITDRDKGESLFAGESIEPMYIQGTFGVFKLQLVAGKHVWSYAASNAGVQGLHLGESAVDSVVIHSLDGSASTKLRVVISGAADGVSNASIAGDTSASLVEDSAEEGVLVASGSLRVLDADANENAFRSQQIEGKFGVLSLSADGQWTYQADNNHSGIQILSAGRSARDEFTVYSLDGASTKISVKIDGVSNTSIGGAEAELRESQLLSVAGQLKNLDTGRNLSATASELVGSIGRLKITSGGAWTWSSESDSHLHGLVQGQSLVDSFLVKTSQGPQLIRILVQGADDPAVISGDSTFSTSEDSVLTGKLSVTDADAGQSLFRTSSVEGSYGAFSLNADGTWSYTPNAHAQTLKAGSSATDTFTAVSADGSAAQLLTITVLGADDAATLVGNISGAVTEDLSTDAAGKLTVTDVDVNAILPLVASGTQAGAYGSFSITAGGNWSYTLANKTLAVQSLAAGATVTDSFVVRTSDSLASTTVTVVITGQNDAAVISGTAAGSLTEDGSSISASLVVKDVDVGDSSTFATVDSQGVYGRLQMDAQGNWVYTVDTSKTQFLAVGASAADFFAVTAADGSQGAIKVSIDGLNDLPVFGSPTVTNGNIPAGTVRASDVDDGASLTYSVASQSVNGTASINAATGAWTFTPTGSFTGAASFTVGVSDGIGALVTQVVSVVVNNSPVLSGSFNVAIPEDQVASGTVTAVDTDSGTMSFSVGSAQHGSVSINASSGLWTYTPSLNYNGSDSFLVTVSDGQGATVSQTITLNVTPVNDVPVLSGLSSGSVTEDASLSASGTLTVSDVDANESSFQVTSSVSTYGSFSISANGAWTYILDNSKAQPLATSVVETFIVKSFDGSNSQTVSITVNGVADPEFITGTLTGSISEDGSTQTGSLTLQSDGLTTSFLASSATGVYGSFSISSGGIWKYTVNTALANRLQLGETAVESFVVKNLSGSTQEEVKITVVGAQDAATITGTVSASINEDSLGVSHQLTAVDADHDQSAFTAASFAGNYGSLSIGSAGLWTYVADARAQALGAGQSQVETFVVQSLDGGSSKTISVTIGGIEDAAVIAGESDGRIVEDDAVNVATGTLAVIDPEAVAPKFEARTSVSGAFGLFSITADGVWTYTLDNSLEVTGSMPEGVLAEDAFLVYSEDRAASQIVTVTIVGADDPGSISGDVAGLLFEDAEANESQGVLVVTDSDALENSFYGQVDESGIYGRFNIDRDGNWVYTLDNSLASTQSLAAGATAVDSFVVLTLDGHTTETVEITVTGVNDIATFAGDFLGSVTEDALSNQATGRIVTSDADANESSLQVRSSTSQYGTFSNLADGTWTFVLDNNQAATQRLAAGATAIDSFLVVSKDGSASQTVNMIITGTNDLATISGSANGTTDEDHSLTSSLSIADVDVGESVFKVSTQTGTYGSWSIAANGSWTFTPNAQQLIDGDSVQDVFLATSFDGKTSQSVTVTVTGVNDAPEVQGALETNVIEDELLLSGGSIFIYDPDSDAPLQANRTFDVINNVSGTYGVFSLSSAGVWTYTLDNAKSVIQTLGGSSTLTDSMHVASADKTTPNFAESDLVVTIQGSNDAALITGTTTGTVWEDASVRIPAVDGAVSTASGTLSVTDTDSGEASFKEATYSGIYGSVSVDANGYWSYTLYNADPDTNLLLNGTTAHDLIKVQSFDGTEIELDISVIGYTDPEPTLTLGSMIIDERDTIEITTAMMDASSLTASDSVLGFKVASVTHGSFEKLVGSAWTVTTSFSLTEVETGKVRFKHDGSETAPTISLKATDGILDSAAKNMTITFSNSNDTPILATDGMIFDAVTHIVNLQDVLHATDIDASDAASRLTYTWAGLDTRVVIRKSGVNVTTFTQADVDAGLITAYRAPGRDTGIIDKEVDFTVVDGQGAARTVSVAIHDHAMLDTGPWTDRTLNFTFLTAVPNYYDPGAQERNGFAAFTDVQKTAARNILNYISSLTNLTFAEVTDVSQSQLTFGSCVQQPGVAAFAYFPTNVVNDQGGDFWFDSESTVQVVPGVNLYRTFLHEIGHALGLSHPYGDGVTFGSGGGSDGGWEGANRNITVMSYNEGTIPSFERGAETYLIHDVAVLQSQYGANMSTRTGDNTYTFSDFDGKVLTPWDAGGNDTYDFSAATYGLKVDIRSGAYSDLYNNTDVGTNNLGMPFNVIIENVKGGSFDDVIQGNDVANVLSGGDGADTLTGNGGADTLKGEAGDDILVITSADFVLADGGAGSDTLRLETANLDLTEFATSALANIEVIDMATYTANAQRLRLSYDDVIAARSSGNLKIDGTNTDTVDLVGDYQLAGNSGGYKTYTSVLGGANATLLIDTDINIV
ncbi:MAG: hypothetical protein RL095_1120 [Verrucomicrobiota bacterium]|jgi:VCBS repeat-containing protein